MTKIKKHNKANIDLIKFAETASSVFDNLLESYRFVNELKEVDGNFCTMIYRKKEIYLKISASKHPLDYPNYYNIIIGEGSTDWPDTDWNSIALWRMKKEISPDFKANEYSLTSFDKIELSLINAKNELEKYGNSFLKEDLSTFKKVRQDFNKQRNPYKIHQPDKKGRYITFIDSISKKLKDKFS